MAFVFSPPPPPSLPVESRKARYPVHRVFCVGRNFADHAAEMGASVDRAAPFYFTKSGHHVAEAKGTIPLAQATQDYHHEIELVVALKSGGQNIAPEDALSHVFAYAIGLDMTRRDLQAAAKDKRRPWDTAKDVEGSALVGVLRQTDHPTGCLELKVNGAVQQRGDVAEMVWSVPEIIADLSRLYTLSAGDLIFMGTPAGVGPVKAGDVLDGHMDGLPSFTLTFCHAE